MGLVAYLVFLLHIPLISKRLEIVQALSESFSGLGYNIYKYGTFVYNNLKMKDCLKFHGAFANILPVIAIS